MIHLIAILIPALAFAGYGVWEAIHNSEEAPAMPPARAVALRAEPEVSALTGFHPYRKGEVR